jgi:uncharacterized membrane protein
MADEEITDNLVQAESLNKSTLSSGEKLLSALGYISFFCILPLVLKQESKFCQFHGKQGLVLTLVFLFLSWLGFLGTFFTILLNIAHVLIAFWGIVNATQGQEVEIPFINKMAKRLDW